MAIDPNVGLMALVTAIFSGGAAWGSARVALNGTRKAVQEIKADVKDSRKDLARHAQDDITVQLAHVERLTRIETKLDEYFREQ